jgi:2-keto-4-pentenoate hydratase/2-oxohepta-3-ene-1,7-dioic acid hydratase in catechol pathway
VPAHQPNPEVSEVRVAAWPILFFKPPSSVIGHEENIIYPSSSQHLIFESELVVVMGKKARNIPAKEALRHVLGYTCGNDVTAYDFILRDNATFHGKSFDTFCPLGPFIENRPEPRWHHDYLPGERQGAGQRIDKKTSITAAPC